MNKEILKLAIYMTFLIMSLSILFPMLPNEKTERDFIASKGRWAPIAYIISFAIGGPCFVPTFMYIFTACTLWSFSQACLYALLGGVFGALNGFLFSRYIASPYLNEHLPIYLLQYKDKMEREPLISVIMTQSILLLSPPVFWFFGLSQIDVNTYLLGTFIGIFPSFVFWTAIGTWFYHTPDWAALVLSIVLFVSANCFVNYLLYKRFWARRDETLSLLELE